MCAYAIRTTGTAQDLINIVIQAGELAAARAEVFLPRKNALARALLETPCNLGGRLARRLLELSPADTSLAWHDAISRRLAAGHTWPFAADAPALSRAAAEVRVLTAATGRPPALLALLSHPPVWGEELHLNFELARHAALALRAARGRPCRPRLTAAVDSYALDTASLPAECFYAGFMAGFDLGLDRLCFSRSRWSTRLAAESAWPRFAFRLLRCLSGGAEAILALSGGVPATARTLYAAREWTAAQRRRSPLRAAPSEVLRRLRQWEDFRRFAALGPHAPRLRRCAWRMLEGWIMSAVAGAAPGTAAGRQPAAETGALGDTELDVLRRSLEALGLDDEQKAQALRELSCEWPRETPFRRRFFRLLAGRLLRQGRPVVWLPVVHRNGGRPGILVREAWTWTALSRDIISGRVLGETPRDWQGNAEDFAVEFGRANYD